jgi:hypothetical protein
VTALKRSVDVEADAIKVSVEGDSAQLEGK